MSFYRGSKPTIILTTFLDFLMFYQMSFSPQAKRCGLLLINMRVSSRVAERLRFRKLGNIIKKFKTW